MLSATVTELVVTLLIYPRGVAPERMPKADATGLAPKKSAYERPSGALIVCRRVSLFVATALHRAQRQLSLSAFLKGFNENPNFIGEVSERRPWAIKREDRPAVFAGRSKSRL